MIERRFREKFSMAFHTYCVYVEKKEFFKVRPDDNSGIKNLTKTCQEH